MCVSFSLLSKTHFRSTLSTDIRQFTSKTDPKFGFRHVLLGSSTHKTHRLTHTLTASQASFGVQNLSAKSEPQCAGSWAEKTGIGDETSERSQERERENRQSGWEVEDEKSWEKGEYVWKHCKVTWGCKGTKNEAIGDAKVFAAREENKLAKE